MKVLVVNIGSTSFKYRLFDLDADREMAVGAVERIGAPMSRLTVTIGDHKLDEERHVPDMGAAVEGCLKQLTDPQQGCLGEASEVAAIGFKAVHGGRYSGTQIVDEDVLGAMEEVAGAAPAHNPPYVAAMRRLGEQLPDIPLVAAFETEFHETIPDANRYYAVPHEWEEKYGVRRCGFHGASHEYIAWRMGKLLDKENPRIISCHLGGSSSLCAARDGKSVATTMGFSPQTGLPQSGRTGDFDIFAAAHVMRQADMSFEEMLDVLAGRSGLAGLGGAGGDLRDIEESAAAGNENARRAIDVYIASIRHYLGAYLVELGGADAIVFTGGIGQNGVDVRRSVCRNLDELGIVLDEEKNATAKGEVRIDAPASRTQIWVVPTNEELVVARRAVRVLKERGLC